MMYLIFIETSHAVTGKKKTELYNFAFGKEDLKKVLVEDFPDGKGVLVFSMDDAIDLETYFD